MCNKFRAPFQHLQLSSLLAKFETFQATRPNTQAWRTLDNEVQEECHNLQYMIDEIDRAIDAAEKNPKRFLLTQAEISERRKWVMKSRRQVEAISDGNFPNLPTKNQKVNGVDAKLANAVEDENSDFIRSEGERQQLLMAQQDQELDVLNQHVVRIGELGREMGQELNSQGQLLDDLGEEMEGTQTRLAAAQKKVQYVLDRAGTKGQLLIIAFLVVVLVVLIFLAIA